MIPTRAVLTFVIAIGVSACALPQQQRSPSSCDGIPAEFGACAPDRPEFSGSDCQEVGAEFGKQLAHRAVPIFDGQRTVDGNDRSALLTHLMVLHVQRANKHLRDNDMAVDCDADEFMAAADGAFSAEFKGRIGQFAFAETVAYDEWLQDLARFLVVIDRDETAPYDPTAPSP